jgi:2'-5' RNA ligase
MSGVVRLFVAAWPNADVLRQIALIRRPTEPGVRWVPKANWHITLRFLGDADADAVATRLGTTELPRAVARLGPALEPLGRRQIVVPVDGVDGLAQAVRSATAGIGERDRHRFRGHLTIARLQPNARSTATGHSIQTEFEIDEIALVTSDLQATGAVYSTIARFPTI